MAEFGKFVGRQEELSLIDEWAGKWGTSHLIVVDGDGGVGKTWLLLEALRRYGPDERYAVVYLDAAEHPYSPWYDLRFLTEQLGEEHFPKLLAGLDELSDTYLHLAPLEYQARERAVLQEGVVEFNGFLAGRRLVYLGDTLEAWNPGHRADEPIRGIGEYTAQFSNALFVVAGRKLSEQMPAEERAFPGETIDIHLRNFYRAESAEFFDAVDPEGMIPADTRDKLHLLTNGRPVLLSLAVEWLRRAVPLPEIADRSLAELSALSETDLGQLCKRFEFELVDRVRGLKSPQDEAVLCMAHIDQRTDTRLLSTLLELSEPEAEALVAQLAELPFVKSNPISGNCMLHDEMKVLVNQHAWPYVDPSGELRLEQKRRVIDEYYLPRIAELEQQAKGWLGLERGPLRRATIGRDEWLRWRLESECLHYYLQVSEREGLAYFEERFLDARRNNHLLRMQFLLNEVETAGYADVGDTLELRRAESLRLNRQFDRARSICENALLRPSLSTQNRASAHVTLGLIAATVDPIKAETHYQRALSLAQGSENKQLLSAVYNNLGQLYRGIGKLQQAVDHLQQAIDYAKQIPNWPLVASATNNLAYVYRQWGNLPRADALCRVALAQRKQLGLERELAYSYLNKAEIDRDKGDLESAERYNKLALRSFDKLDEQRGQALAYESLANIHRHIGQFQSSETYVQEGLHLASQLNDDLLRARLYNVYGREQRDHAMHALELGEEQEAAELLQRSLRYQELSLELAGQYGDPWLTTRSRYELALTYFLGHLRPEAEVNSLLDEVWGEAERLEHTLVQGYVQELRGEIALREGDYPRAALQFGQATLLMAQLASRESNRFFDRISDYLLAADLTPEDALTLARGILDVIGPSGAGGGPLQPLRALCQQVLALRG